MLHASALAVGWKSAFYALFKRESAADATVTPGLDILRSAQDSDEEREPFHLDDPEIALRLVTSRGLQEYITPPHAHLLFPSINVR
jgi:hypothetical protein